jgi:ketopantoate reductase
MLMRSLIVSTGATGGDFAARLAQAGRDVTFLVRPARAKKPAKSASTSSDRTAIFWSRQNGSPRTS